MDTLAPTPGEDSTVPLDQAIDDLISVLEVALRSRRHRIIDDQIVVVEAAVRDRRRAAQRQGDRLFGGQGPVAEVPRRCRVECRVAGPT